MIKYICLILLFALICYIGYGIFNYYKKRENFYADLSKFINKISEEMNFLKTDLISLIDKNKCAYNNDCNDLLNSYLDYLLSTKKDEPFKIKSNFLSKEEKEEINTFFNSLGKSNLEEQKVCIALYRSRFSEQFTKSTKEKDTNGIVSLKLCIVLALFVCLILF